jgi:hypothetical protein
MQAGEISAVAAQVLNQNLLGGPSFLFTVRTAVRTRNQDVVGITVVVTLVATKGEPAVVCTRAHAR